MLRIRPVTTARVALLAVVAFTVAGCSLFGGDDEASTDDSTGLSLLEPALELPDGVSEEQAQLTVLAAVSSTVPAAAQECTAEALKEEPDLYLAVFNQGDLFSITTLPPDDQVTLAGITIACSGPGVLGQFVAEGLTEVANATPPPAVIDCYEARLAGPQADLVFVGMTAVNEGITPTDSARQPTIAALDECLPPSFLVGSFVEALGAGDPAYANAVDVACVDTAYAAAPGTMLPLWTEFVANPQPEFTGVAPATLTTAFAPTFGCISLAGVVTSQLALAGIEASEDSLACIDRELASGEFYQSVLTTRTIDPLAVLEVLTICLPPEQLAELGLTT